MIPALLLLLAGAPTAQAAPGLTGAEGLLDVAQPEVPAADAMNMSVGLRAVGTPQGLSLGGLPVGLALGLSRRLAVGFRIEPYDPTLQQDPFGGASVAARMRVLDPVDKRFGVAVQAEVGRFREDPLADVIGIVGKDFGRLSHTMSLGPRWHARGGFGVTGGTGVGVDLAGSAEAMGELSALIDERALSEWTGKTGVRGLVGPLQVTAWAGGGFAEGLPWAGGGVAMALASVDLRQVDRDQDAIADLDDDCAYAEEDVDGFQDEDGCPDPDNDGDGILDVDDPTPNGEEEVVDEGPHYTTALPKLRLRIHQVQLPGAAAAAVRHDPPAATGRAETGDDAPAAPTGGSGQEGAP